MKLDIVKYPAPVLKRVAAPVDNIDSKIVKLAQGLKRMQRSAKGYGVAAPQLGFSKQLFTFVGPGGDIEVAINPTIRDTFGTVRGWEGCLSLPGRTYSITRPERVTLAFTTLDGQEKVIEADGLLARCFMHEMDHLQGVLIVDIKEDDRNVSGFL